MRLPIRKYRNDGNAREPGMMPVRDMIDRLMDDNFWGPFAREHRGGWMPRVDVSETSQEFRIEVDAPGVDPKQVNISVEDGVLSISGKTEEKREEEGETFYRMEREYGSFRRSMELPAGADTEHIAATAKNGVIHIVVPKKPEAQRKPITIKVQDSAA